MKKKKIKLCLTKQLLNMFKLWCEWGIRLVSSSIASYVNCCKNDEILGKTQMFVYECFTDKNVEAIF